MTSFGNSRRAVSNAARPITKFPARARTSSSELMRITHRRRRAGATRSSNRLRAAAQSSGVVGHSLRAGAFSAIATGCLLRYGVSRWDVCNSVGGISDIIPATGLFRQLTDNSCISWRIVGARYMIGGIIAGYQEDQEATCGGQQKDRHKMADAVFRRTRGELVLYFRFRS